MNFANIILLITQGTQLVATLWPVGMAAAMAIKKLFEASDAGYEVQMIAVVDGAVKTADETLALIKAWEDANPTPA